MNPNEIRPGSHDKIVNSERRKYPRFNVDLPVEYCLSASSPATSDRIVNISEGGLLIYFRERMHIGQHLKLTLFFNLGPALTTIELSGEVAWLDFHPDERWENYRSGVAFINISLDDMSKLKSLLVCLSQPPYTQ